MKIFFLLIAVFLLTSCKIHILDAEFVSMMTDKLPNNPKIGEAIEEEWCIDEVPEDEDLLKGPGYLDRVTLKAHKNYDAKYFADVSFYQTGTCAFMRGKVVR